mmetsp:Transcript_35979/g.76788  ORF Transcript_35979/g.76788 Transcript_35979/m.76788 type:complete len:382 (+) Transcript_35979:213-1358(+)|eukprot:CAMPEP_0172552234 /NCGR_PEP_ID=MMETSP1067-20121228/43698_1 /TAXON_ID=265564 ORGANISM="Thalassiosira punctigera, Strain Tpunct2005C2" /NCGR_SAMPLE_ID=MMETSP1067 /ASSEMBLY_ACC=CAM_ASM_000444 /LENGTH=381 /DNA_ID=CAMNT_0013340165 /DNA_START=207 /DNA_END=1352 /DNA_ORIENTATION=-
MVQKFFLKTFEVLTLCAACNLVDAFSPTLTHHPLLRTRPHTANKYHIHRVRKCCDSRRNTQLHEQPINIRNLLGPISPSTLEKYNLPHDVLLDGWAAQVVTRTAKSLDEATDVQLVPRNSKEHFVDTVKVEIPIPLDCPGLGIELLEVEGGREDGLGIVIVNGIVPNSNAERANVKSRRKEEERDKLMYGDSIVAAELVLGRIGSSVKDQTDVASIRTECLGYDSTVDALGGMLSLLGNTDKSIKEATVNLTLKRLRRRPLIEVTLHYPSSQGLPPEKITLQPGDNLRLAMLQRGVKLNDPLAQRYDGKATGSGNCGGGSLCRTCAVSILRGGELLSRPKQNEKMMIEGDNMPRWRLACKSWVGYGMKEGEIVVQVNPRQW